MYDSIPTWISRWSVASALTGVLATVLLLGLPVRAKTDHGDLVGQARVIDGDTVEISGRHVRLEGIDAPEMAQTCTDHTGGSWRCGQDAARALERLVAGHSLTCEDKGTDKYGRMLGVCFSGSRDVNAEMVRQGLAWAFVKYSRSYVREEAEARALHIGIWQGERKACLGLPGRTLGRSRGHRTARLCHQRQRLRQRPHLPPAVEHLVRQGPHRREQGRTVVLQRGRGIGRRLASSRDPLSLPLFTLHKRGILTRIYAS